MRCIAANRTILTAIDQNATFPDNNGSYSTAMTNDIDSTDTIQFADGWYSYPDLDTFDSNILLNTLTIRINIKPTKIISPWNTKAENPAALPLTEIGTRQLEALFNLSQLLFGLSRAEQSNYTFRDLQLGLPSRRFYDAGFKIFSNNNNNKSIFQLLVNEILKTDAIDVVFMMYKDSRLRCVKQKSLDFLTNIATIPEISCLILTNHSQFLLQLIQGIRDGHLIEEKIPSLSLLLRLIDKNLFQYYPYLIDMQFIDILIDIFENKEYKSNIYFTKFQSFAFQCLHIILQSIEHVDQWSEKAQTRLVNYCCTFLYESVLNEAINPSLSSGILIFLNIIRCRKEIEKFYRENEHFKELINVMKEKYDSQDSTISYALDQVVNVIFEKKKYYQHRKCSNSLCQNEKIQFEDFYCSQYCLNHKEESTVLCMIDRFSQYQDNKTTFETLPIHMSKVVIDETAEIPNDLCYPSSSSSTGKKKSLKTLLSLLRINGKR